MSGAQFGRMSEKRALRDAGLPEFRHAARLHCMSDQNDTPCTHACIHIYMNKYIHTYVYSRSASTSGRKSIISNVQTAIKLFSP